MTTIFHIKAVELDETFLANLKRMFGNKYISITVDEEQDETEYLLSSENNRKMLLESITQAEKGNLITVDIGKNRKK